MGWERAFVDGYNAGKERARLEGVGDEAEDEFHKSAILYITKEFVAKDHPALHKHDLESYTERFWKVFGETYAIGVLSRYHYEEQRHIDGPEVDKFFYMSIRWFNSWLHTE